MNIKRILILTLVILTSCGYVEKKVEFQQSDRKNVVLKENFFSNDYLEIVEFKNDLYSKTFDEVTLETTYEYQSELWKRNTIIGGFITSTYLYPISDLNDMEDYFLAHIAGQTYEESISPDFRFERTYEFKLPYKKYHIYKVYKNDTLNMGFTFNILKDNKIIITSIVSSERLELEIEQLINRVNKI